MANWRFQRCNREEERGGGVWRRRGWPRRSGGGQCLAIDVLILPADSSTNANDLLSKLQGTGRFNSVTVLLATTNTPTLQDLLNYDAVITWSNSTYQNNNALGDVLADYVDAGGGVVVTVFAVSTTTVGRSLGGRWQDNPAYEAIVCRTGNASGAASLGTIHDPNHPTVQGVSTLSGTNIFRTNGTGIHPGSTLIASWNDGRPLVVEGSVPNRVDLGLFPPSSDINGAYWTGDGAALMANALEYVSGGAGGPRLNVSGTCPGTITVEWSGATPSRPMGLVFARNEGSYVIPGGACSGTELGLGTQNLQLIRQLNSGPNGSGQVSGAAGTAACGGFLQLVIADGSPCATSNVRQIPQ